MVTCKKLEKSQTWERMKHDIGVLDAKPQRGGLSEALASLAIQLDELRESHERLQERLQDHSGEYNACS